MHLELPEVRVGASLLGSEIFGQGHFEWGIQAGGVWTGETVRSCSGLGFWLNGNGVILMEAFGLG